MTYGRDPLECEHEEKLFCQVVAGAEPEREVYVEYDCPMCGAYISMVYRPSRYQYVAVLDPEENVAIVDRTAGDSDSRP